MNLRYVFPVLCALLISSCARMEQRGAHYDQNKCPFCVMKPGACHDCAGSGKCTFCKGTGVRKTTTNGFASEKINSVTYEEKCPYCSGTGVCKYCDGKGKCRHCKGDGKIENWNFFEEYSAGIKSESAQATERNTDK